MMCFLNEGVALLREGLQRSPYNFKLKLLLFLLYLELGAAQRNKTLAASFVLRCRFSFSFRKNTICFAQTGPDTHSRSKRNADKAGRFPQAISTTRGISGSHCTCGISRTTRSSTWCCRRRCARATTMLRGRCEETTPDKTIS
eukprot:COSAG06_NODE_222_length_19858_cov_7.238372_8_plen_143_part_00